MRRLTHGTERCGRGALRVTTLLTLLTALLVAPAVASAADFNPAPGSYTADTTTLKITGTGTNITGVNEGGVAVFRFGDVSIPPGVSINATGTRPLKIVASGSLTLGGGIFGGGTSPNDFEAGPFSGGPGGGAGGVDGSGPGAGPGGGRVGPGPKDGGGGGGFGGIGARGGLLTGGAGGAGGVVYGNLNRTLQGGSGGAGGTASTDVSAVGGGGGGGAVALFGSIVTIQPGGTVRVDGGSGASGNFASSGGGSGGGIVIHGDTVNVNGTLLARGGAGGANGQAGGSGVYGGDGGGGGGGRVAYQFRTLVASGTAQVFGGATGARSTSGCCDNGGTSPDPAGAPGVVTFAQASTSTTGPATGVSASGATINGTINPRGNPTTFHFDFGTTTGYGTRVPGSDATAGSDNSDHGVSQAVGGLAPSTTYHYRLVATDSMGFTTNGADVGFTTPAAPPPPPTGGGGGSGPPPVVGVVPSTTSINSLGFTKYTKLLNLAAKNLPAGATVTVTCKTKKKGQQKKGCPYKKKRFTTSGGRASLNLRKPFSKKKVPIGTKITITITAPGFLGKQIQYTMRKGKIPKSRVRCLSAAGKVGSCA
jgi:hypothetical protein